MALDLGILPVLLPGRPVLRRDQHTWQVGIRTPVPLRDTPPILALLQHLDPTRPDGPEPVDPTDPAVVEALNRLHAAGHLSGTPTTGRGSVGLTVLGPGLTDRIEDLLRMAGIGLDEDAAGAHLFVSGGPLSRDHTDELVQSGIPHLVVTCTEDSWRIGPFVVPGVTACQRCVDAHESASDPRRGLLVEQAARHARAHPAPSDPLTEVAALAWAVNDLRTYLDGGEPSTWSATVDLPAPATDRNEPVLTRWLRHPECGCAWDLLLDLP